MSLKKKILVAALVAGTVVGYGSGFAHLAMMHHHWHGDGSPFSRFLRDGGDCDGPCWRGGEHRRGRGHGPHWRHGPHWHDGPGRHYEGKRGRHGRHGRHGRGGHEGEPRHGGVPPHDCPYSR